MADIELVIKIPEELLEYFANHNCMSEDGWFSHSSKLLDAFRNGTPLPKGHGRVIDESKITKCEQVGLIMKNGNITHCLKTDAPTIIKESRK